MDQIKIGKFIAECRKKNKLTQMQLAEKLNITDRAISKWENGKTMPDSSIMLDLCKELKINVNELLSGEVINMDNYNEKAEELLVEMKKQKEEADKKMLQLEWVIGYMSSITFLILVFVASYVEMPKWLSIVLIVFGTVSFAVGMGHALRIEQTAGYYECANCHHKYVPEYKSVFWAMHFGRTRYMKCPKCNTRTWNKKVLSK